MYELALKMDISIYAVNRSVNHGRMIASVKGIIF